MKLHEHRHMTLQQIKAGLKAHKIKHKALAEKMGLSKVRISQWFTGYRNPTIDNLTLIEKAYRQLKPKNR